MEKKFKQGIYLINIDNANFLITVFFIELISGMGATTAR